MPKISNATKYREYQRIIKERDDCLLAKFFSDKTIPKILYANRALGGVREVHVESVYAYSRPMFFAESKPSNEKVSMIAAEAIKQKTELLPEEVFVSFKEDIYCGADAWDKINTTYSSHYFTKELAEAANIEWMDKYAPRANHFACEQCGKQTPIENVVTGTIILYGGTRQARRFCSSTCACHNQWAQEG